jgi:phosphoribosyl 1,2-cyclic phosphodiesterase
MRVAVLGSGSRGNALVIESGGRSLLLDAGFSCREIERRMAHVGADPAQLVSVLVTHEHGDHVRGLDRLCRRHDLTWWASEGTLRGARGISQEVGQRVSTFRSGDRFEVAGFQVEPFAIPHDAREPVGFVVEDESGARLGLVADLGSRSRLAWGRLRDLDMLVLESNHDLEMLRDGPYPWATKQRIAGRHGHLSNREAAEGIPELVTDRLRHVVLYHLSETNNLPALAAASVGEALEREGCQAELAVTEQGKPSCWWEVER